MANPTKKRRYCKGNLVYITYGKFGIATVLNNGRQNPFNHDEVIYRVQSSATDKIESFNEHHIKLLIK